GKLTGAMHSFMAGTNLFVVGKNGFFVLGLRNDAIEAPTIIGELTTDTPFTPSAGEKVAGRPREGKSDGASSPRLLLKNPRAVSVQFRYAFVADDEGFKVVDITEPTRPRLIPGATMPLKHARRFYLARTYACVANGPEGLALIDIENPEKPRLEMMYNADGQLNDTR